MVEVVVIGAYRLWANAIGRALDREPGIAVRGWGTTEEASSLVARCAPAVVVLGTVRLERPFREALRARIDLALSAGPGCAFVVTSLSAEATVVHDAFAAGASGFVAADDDIASLRDTVLAVGGGGTHVSPTAASSIARAAGAGTALSPREAQVLERVARGWSSSEIAGDLHVSVRVVESDRSAIGRKLGVHGRREVVAWAIRRGIVA